MEVGPARARKFARALRVTMRELVGLGRALRGLAAGNGTSWEEVFWLLVLERIEPELGGRR